ncbi:hypothetical protein HYC85_021288 [Camellia sinensis]|uniref:Uncharacterized protein n=1 Tax=Camellia sinensis TaxID=4442 RepID=A0A7J7GJP4_CAMSI|nr:hypothetical protein HYC85_021288 [Camellia sinensis]
MAVMMTEKDKVLGETALKAVKEGGLSHRNLMMLIEEREQLNAILHCSLHFVEIRHSNSF